MMNDTDDYELFGYKFSLYKTNNGLYKIVSLTNLDLVGCPPGEALQRIARYKVVLSFIEETLKTMNA